MAGRPRVPEAAVWWRATAGSGHDHAGRGTGGRAARGCDLAEARSKPARPTIDLPTGPATSTWTGVATGGRRQRRWSRGHSRRCGGSRTLVVYLNTPGLVHRGQVNGDPCDALLPPVAGHLLQSISCRLPAVLPARSDRRGVLDLSGGSGGRVSGRLDKRSCGHNFPNQLLATGRAFTGGEITDFNGDGFIDLVFNSSRVEMVSAGPPTLVAPAKVNSRLQIVSSAQADATNVDVVFNLQGINNRRGHQPVLASAGGRGAHCVRVAVDETGHARSNLRHRGRQRRRSSG